MFRRDLSPLRQSLHTARAWLDFLDLTKPEVLDAALQKKPKCIWRPSNPMLKLIDIVAIAEKAHKAGAMVVVDNTFMTPVFQRPLELGGPWWSTAPPST